MSYHGDVSLGSTIDIKFATRQATGAPTTLAGTPAVAAYVGNGTTEITAGITLSVDFDSRTGLNHLRVVASTGNGFATATDIELVITAGTVNGVSVVGEVVGSFSIENRSALRPTSAGRTLDVSVTGEAGLDWANIGSPATTVGLSGTTAGDTAGTTALLLRLTLARSGYLDNLNVGGNLASHADVLAINTSSSRHLILTTVGQYERPESGSTVYTIECRTFAALDGVAVNADTTPTLTATGQTSGSLAGNLSAATNAATGVYRWTYAVASGATSEPIRFDVSATISSSTFTLSCYTQVVDEVSQTWTSTDASHLTSIFNKLPTNNIADETVVLAAIGTPMQAYTQPTGFLAATFPATVASTTNITAGTIATVTNLTNAPTVGDFTTAMKTSLNAATPASIQNIVAQTADVGGVVAALASAHGAGSWATATGFVTDKTGYSLAAGGLDAIPITDPGGVSGQTTFPKVLVALYRRFFNKTILTKTGVGTATINTYANNGTSVNTTQALTDDGTIQTQGTAT